MANLWRNRCAVLALAAVIAVGCSSGSGTVVVGGDPDLATPAPPDQAELSAILEHVDTHVTDFGDGWELVDQWYTEGAITEWSSDCDAFNRLGDMFNAGTPMTAVWERGDDQVTLRTDDFNWSAYKFAHDIERIPTSCTQVTAGSTTVAVSSVDETMFSSSLAALREDDPRGVIAAIRLDAYPIPDPATDVRLPEFQASAPTWIVIVTRHNVVSQLIHASAADSPTTIIELVDAQVRALVGTVPEGTGSFRPPEPPPSVAPGVERNVQLVLTDPECRNAGSVDAGGVVWGLIDPVPFGWDGRSVIEGDLEMAGMSATFTSNGADGTPVFTVALTTGGTNMECLTWELDEPVAQPNAIGDLDCGTRVVVEDRVPDDDTDPLDVATSFIPAAARVEPTDPLLWDVFDDAGAVVGLLGLGDVENPDWQVWSCG